MNGQSYPGQWKLLVDESLLLSGTVNPQELYELSSDSRESKNRIDDPKTRPLVDAMAKELKDIHHRGGLRR